MGSGVSLGRSRLKRPQKLEGHEGSINAICLSSDGGLVATASDDGTARVRDTETLEQISQMRGHHQYVNCLAMTANDEFVITGKSSWYKAQQPAVIAENIQQLVNYPKCLIFNFGIYLITNIVYEYAPAMM